MKTVNKTNNVVINNANNKEEIIMSNETNNNMKKPFIFTSANKDNGIVVPVGDFSNDKYYPDCQQNDSSNNHVVLDKKHGDYIVKNIVKVSFIATKGDSKGHRIVTMHKLFGIIRKAYANGNEQIDEVFIKDIINQLVTLKYIRFKKYESGAMVFYPTVKCKEYIK